MVKISDRHLWKVPPAHPWYGRQAPGGALAFKGDRVVQTTISRLASGHIKCLFFDQCQKTFRACTNCNSEPASPEHLLSFAGLDRNDINTSPHLVYDFLKILGLVDLV